MLPFINVFGFKLPMYSLMALIGIVLAIVAACTLAKGQRLLKEDVAYAGIYAVIGLIIGAKLLYFITFIPKIIKHWDVFTQNVPQVLFLALGGFVFYGGLIGAIVGILVYCKQFKLPWQPYMNVAAPAIPLMHCFGRIGCLLAGCCYGKEYHGPFAIRFPENDTIEHLHDVERFPTQPVEIIFNFILFVCLYIYVKKGKSDRGQALGIYFVAYSIMRFILEFFRGDAIRGVDFYLSTSQWISLVLFPAGLYILLKGKNKENKNH